jgi:hypothetical protein
MAPVATQPHATGHSSVLCDSRSDPNKPEESLMAFVHKRLVAMNELPDTPMDNNTFKSLTGRDPFTARGLYANQACYWADIEHT